MLEVRASMLRHAVWPQVHIVTAGVHSESLGGDSITRQRKQRQTLEDGEGGGVCICMHA